MEPVVNWTGSFHLIFGYCFSKEKQTFPPNCFGWFPTSNKSLLVYILNFQIHRKCNIICCTHWQMFLFWKWRKTMYILYLHFPERVFSASWLPIMVRKLTIHFQIPSQHWELHNMLWSNADVYIYIPLIISVNWNSHKMKLSWSHLLILMRLMTSEWFPHSSSSSEFWL